MTSAKKSLNGTMCESSFKVFSLKCNSIWMMVVLGFFCAVAWDFIFRF